VVSSAEILGCFNVGLFDAPLGRPQMNELLNKVSSYNIFNYLLPGIVFAVLASEILHYPLVQRNLLTAAFLYYFVGMVVSRFGSLIIQPVLRKLSLVRFEHYDHFIDAEKKDPKIEVLSEVNNTYRTFCALFILLLLLKLYLKVENRLPCLRQWDETILAALLLALFIFAYRKQTAFIKSRIQKGREQ
jgi:hypothetical protein